jgi:hypothetical protein
VLTTACGRFAVYVTSVRVTPPIRRLAALASGDGPANKKGLKKPNVETFQPAGTRDKGAEHPVRVHGFGMARWFELDLDNERVTRLGSGAATPRGSELNAQR